MFSNGLSRFGIKRLCVFFSEHSLSKDAKNQSGGGHHCTGSPGWDLVSSSRGLGERVAGQDAGDVLALESGNNVAVNANALQATVLMVVVVFKSTYPHHTRPRVIES